MNIAVRAQRLPRSSLRMPCVFSHPLLKKAARPTAGSTSSHGRVELWKKEREPPSKSAYRERGTRRFRALRGVPRRGGPHPRAAQPEHRGEVEAPRSKLVAHHLPRPRRPSAVRCQRLFSPSPCGKTAYTRTPSPSPGPSGRGLLLSKCRLVAVHPRLEGGAGLAQRQKVLGEDEVRARQPKDGGDDAAEALRDAEREEVAGLRASRRHLEKVDSARAHVEQVALRPVRRGAVLRFDHLLAVRG